MHLRLVAAALLLVPPLFASPPGEARSAAAMLLAPAFARQPARGRVGAEHARGVDVSHHQGPIDWRAVEGDGVAFAYVKATEGATFADPAFARNWAALGATTIARGAYHRFRPRADALAQARHFLAVVPAAENDLPAVLDVEALDGVGDARLVAGVRAWLAEVERATGKRPILYTKPRFLREHLGHAVDDYPLWIAQYGADRPSADGWVVWQQSAHGRIAGIAGDVDLDRLNAASALAAALNRGTEPVAR